MKPVIHTSKTDTKTLILRSNRHPGYETDTKTLTLRSDRHPGSKTDTKVRFLFPYEVD